MTDHRTGPPDKRKPGPTPGTGPLGKSAEATDKDQITASGRWCPADTVTCAWRRRRASHRLPVLDCGHSDPWRSWRPEHVSDLQVDGYRAAVQHLRAHGLLAAPNIPAMQELWRLGGEDRRLVSELAAAWELAA